MTITTDESAAPAAWDAHLYIKAIPGRFGFSINSRTPKGAGTEKEIARDFEGLLPTEVDNYEATLLTIRVALAALRELREETPPRATFIHTDCNNAFWGGKRLEQWRESGLFFTKDGEPLPKEAAWRAIVAETQGGPTVTIDFVKKGSPARMRLFEIAAALRSGTNAAVA